MNVNNEEMCNALIMVRPDGHIASIGLLDEKQVEEESLMKQLNQVLKDGFQNALGDIPLLIE